MVSLSDPLVVCLSGHKGIDGGRGSQGPSGPQGDLGEPGSKGIDTDIVMYGDPGEPGYPGIIFYSILRLHCLACVTATSSFKSYQ